MVFEHIYEKSYSRKQSNAIAEEWLKKGYKELGHGMSRRAFYDGNIVYKLSKNMGEGIEGNKLEYNLCSKYADKFGDVLLKVYDHSDDWLWISCEYAPEPKRADFKRIHNVEFSQIDYLMSRFGDPKNKEEAANSSPYLKRVWECIQVLKKEKIDLVDFTMPENWGIRQGKQIIMVDLAMTDELFAAFRGPKASVGQMVMYPRDGTKIGVVLAEDDYQINTDTDGWINKTDIRHVSSQIPELKELVKKYMKTKDIKLLDAMDEFTQDSDKYF
jgi:hypothetical protein